MAGVDSERLPKTWGESSGIESWAPDRQRQVKVISVMGTKAIVGSRRPWPLGICVETD